MNDYSITPILLEKGKVFSGKLSGDIVTLDNIDLKFNIISTYRGIDIPVYVTQSDEETTADLAVVYLQENVLQQDIFDYYKIDKIS